MEINQPDDRKLSELIYQKRAKTSAREAAREMLDHLNKWHAQYRELAKTKWVWELIQNARDVAKRQNKRNFKVSFILDKNRLLFEHDAGPFSLDDIYNLIHSRSDKPLESPEIIGQFGKGFLITHILSGKVKVRGWLKDDVNHINKTFEITLDRSIQNNDELTVKHIENNIEDCSRQLDNPGPSLEQDLTQYEYSLDEGGYNAAVAGLNALRDALPFVLVFSDPKMTVTIFQDSQVSIYSVAETRIIQSQPARIELLKIDDSYQGVDLLVITSNDSKVKIAVPYSSSDQTILKLNDIPRLFKTYPLTKTEDLDLPVVIDAHFRVSAERFDLQYRKDDQIKELEDILRAATSLMEELCKWALSDNIRCKELLFKIKAPPEGKPYREQWIQALSSLVRNISQLKAVEVAIDFETNKTGLFLEPDSVYFPSQRVGSDFFEDEEFISTIWDLSYRFGLKVPVKKLINEWNEIRRSWKSLGITVGREQTFEELVKKVNELGSLSELKKKTPLNTDDKALNFLKCLYSLGNYYRSKRKQIPEFLKSAIYCNQNGAFKEPQKLSIDNGVPDALKKISEALFEPLCDKLLHAEFSKDDELKQHFQALGLNIMDENKAISILYDAIYGNWEKMAKIDTNKYRQGVMEFEKWLLQNKDVKSLEGLLGKEDPLRKLPLLCEDNELRVLREKEYFVPPDLLLEEEAREHTRIWPSDTKLSKGYSEGVADLTLIKDRMVAAKICQPDLFFNEEEELSEQHIKDLCAETTKTMRSIYASAEHVAKTTVSKVIAFDKVLKSAERSRNPELTRAILTFILGYLVPRDDSWQKLKNIEAQEVGPTAYGKLAPTGRKRSIQIYPSLWLSQIKRNKWVTIVSVDDKGNKSFDVNEPTKDNLTEHLKILQPSILSNEKVQMFLQQKFGFSLFEIVGWLLTSGESGREQALANNLKQIYEWAHSQGIDPINWLSEKIFEEQKKDKFIRRNTNFGLIIEKAVRKTFEQLKFREYGFEVIPRWKGYDFDAYLSKQIEESDYGSFGIEVKKIQTGVILKQFEVEVKATRADTITMTLTQANNAVDHADRYLLCVVDAKDLSINLDDLCSASLTEEQTEKLSEEISPYISIISIGEDLKQIIADFRRAISTASPNITVDYNARFIISSKLWRAKGKSINEWFTSVLRELNVPAES